MTSAPDNALTNRSPEPAAPIWPHPPIRLTEQRVDRPTGHVATPEGFALAPQCEAIACSDDTAEVGHFSDAFTGRVGAQHQASQGDRALVAKCANAGALELAAPSSKTPADERPPTTTRDVEGNRFEGFGSTARAAMSKGGAA